ncbi:unnamed protein product [Lathyrus sativus]|nr:unnamed protein product [Lathyrus sativus]
MTFPKSKNASSSNHVNYAATQNHDPQLNEIASCNKFYSSSSTQIFDEFIDSSCLIQNPARRSFEVDIDFTVMTV